VNSIEMQTHMTNQKSLMHVIGRERTQQEKDGGDREHPDKSEIKGNSQKSGEARESLGQDTRDQKTGRGSATQKKGGVERGQKGRVKNSSPGPNPQARQ